MSKFRANQQVTMYVTGAGVTSTEMWKVESVRKGVVRLQDSPKTFDAETGTWTNDDGWSMGFTFRIEPAP